MSNKLKFELKYNDETREVCPSYDKIEVSQKILISRVYGLELGGDISFERNDFTYIMDKALGTKFILIIKEQEGFGLGYIDRYKFEFTVLDAEVDYYTRSIKGIKFRSLDKGTLFAQYLETKIDIEAAKVAAKETLISIPNILQLRMGDKVINITGSNIWEEVYVGYTNTADFWSPIQWMYINGIEADIHGVSGWYIVPNRSTSIGANNKQWVNVNGNARIEFVGNGSTDFEFKLFYGQNQSLVKSVFGGSGSTDPEHGTVDGLTRWTFDLQDGTNTINYHVYSLACGARYLTASELSLTMANISPIPRPIDDFSEVPRRIYPYYAVVGLSEYLVDIERFLYIYDGSADENQGYGKYPDDIQFNAGLYYKQLKIDPLTGDTKYYEPVNRQSWGRYSLWFRRVDGIVDLLNNRMATRLMSDSYLYEELVSEAVLIATEGIISYNYDSKYLNNEAGTARENEDTKIMCTFKSNIIATVYDTAAKKEKITLKDILELATNYYNCEYTITDNGLLVIEHRAYFENGNSYTTNNARDLTAEIYLKSGRGVVSDQMTIKYNTDELADSLFFKLADNLSNVFNLYKLKSLDEFRPTGKDVTLTVGRFSTDLNYLIGSTDANKDGFAFFEAKQTPDGIYNALNNTINIDGMTYIIQSYQTYPNYIFKYWRWGAYFARFEGLGGLTYPSLSTKEVIEQEIELPNISGIKAGDVIVTKVGTGTIVDFKKNLSHEQISLTLRYGLKP